MKYFALTSLVAVLALSSFSLSAVAAQVGSVATTPCSGLIYYNEHDKRICVSALEAESMSTDAMATVIAAIERSTLKIASIDLELGKRFASENHGTVVSLCVRLGEKKERIVFSDQSGESINSIATDIAKAFARNAALDAKIVVLDKLRERLATFQNWGRLQL